jgi:glycyl-tRNA synthetase beta subunit
MLNLYSNSNWSSHEISKLQDTQDNNWDEYLQAVVFAYNTGIHKTTKYSPYELLYGRLPRLPIDTRHTHFTFNKPNDYFEQLKKTLRIYHQSTRHNIIQQQQMNKNWFDKNRLDPEYRIGDKVLTRIYGLRGK